MVKACTAEPSRSRCELANEGREVGGYAPSADQASLV